MQTMLRVRGWGYWKEDKRGREGRGRHTPRQRLKRRASVAPPTSEPAVVTHSYG